MCGALPDEQRFEYMWSIRARERSCSACFEASA
jgi:hypothetical protein